MLVFQASGGEMMEIQILELGSSPMLNNMDEVQLMQCFFQLNLYFFADIPCQQASLKKGWKTMKRKNVSSVIFEGG